MGGAIQILEQTHQRCVVKVPVDPLGVLIVGLLFTTFMFGWWGLRVLISKKRVDPVPVTADVLIRGWVLICVLFIPFFLALGLMGPPAEITFDRNSGTVTVVKWLLFVYPKRTVVPLSNVGEAVVRGRNGWLQLRLNDGGDINLTADTQGLSGLDDTADTINKWMEQSWTRSR
jgi:hypothetical protein